MSANKLYVCRKIKLNNYLLRNGYRFEREEIDKYDPSRKIWLYIDTPELHETIEQYYAEA